MSYFSHERNRSRAFGTRALLTVASLFALATFTTPARAQEVSEPDNVIALRDVDFTDRTAFSPFAALGTSFENDRSLNLGNTPRARNESVEGGENEIVVTALWTENFISTENSEFDENIFDRMGVEPTINPDLVGLAFLTPEEMRDNGWALNVPVFGSRRGETGPFISVGAGRPERLIIGGVRF
jgi:hypothetical protein